MVRSCALAFVCSMVLLVLAGWPAVAQDPFGSKEAELAGENPFGEEPAKQQQVAATNPPKRPEQTQIVRLTSSNERVRSTLEEPTKMEFVDMPLQDAVEFLKDFHQLEIQLDHRALEDAGVGSDTPVSRNLPGLPLKSALRILLGDLDLAHVVQNDVLLITTKDKASEMREVRVYDVTKLVAPDAKADEVGQMLTMLLSEASQQSGGGLVPPGLQRIRVVRLRDLLVIRASQDEHDEIAEVLMEVANTLLERG